MKSLKTFISEAPAMSPRTTVGIFPAIEVYKWPKDMVSMMGGQFRVSVYIGIGRSFMDAKGFQQILKGFVKFGKLGAPKKKTGDFKVAEAQFSGDDKKALVEEAKKLITMVMTELKRYEAQGIVMASASTMRTASKEYQYVDISSILKKFVVNKDDIKRIK